MSHSRTPRSLQARLQSSLDTWLPDNRRLCAVRAWTLAGAWFLPNARDRDPAPPEPFLNQALAPYLLAACPGFPPGTAELADPACAVCSPAMGPQEQRPLWQPGSQLSLVGGTPARSISFHPGKTFEFPPEMPSGAIGAIG